MMNRGLRGWVWIKWEDCLYSSAVYTMNVLGTTLDYSASMLGLWNVRLHGKLNIVSILGYRYIFMSTVNNRAVKSSRRKRKPTENVRYWCFIVLEKTQKNLRGAGVGVWLPPLSYVRGLICKNLRQTASDHVQFLKQEPAYKNWEGPDPNKGSNQQ